MKIDFTQSELQQIYTALSYLKARSEKNFYNDSSKCYDHVIYDKSRFDNLDPDTIDIHELIRKIYFRIDDESKLEKIDSGIEEVRNFNDEDNEKIYCPESDLEN